jgi:hypothetical protein
MCDGAMHVIRRTPAPGLIATHEMQTLFCPDCKFQRQRIVDADGVPPSVEPSWE